MSRLISRQIGLLIDRQGRVELTIIGTATAILIPELSRERSTSGRLRGLRLLHTHLNNAPLSHEDLMDLLFLRLDSVAVLTVDEHGMPQNFQSAHLLPHQVEDIPEAQGWTHSKKKKDSTSTEDNTAKTPQDVEISASRFDRFDLFDNAEDALTQKARAPKAQKNKSFYSDTSFTEPTDDSNESAALSTINDALQGQSSINDIMGFIADNLEDITGDITGDIEDDITYGITGDSTKTTDTNANTKTADSSQKEPNANKGASEQVAKEPTAKPTAEPTAEEQEKAALSSVNIKEILSRELHKQYLRTQNTNTQEDERLAQRQKAFGEKETKEPYQVSEFIAWDKIQNNFSTEIDALEEEFARLIRNVRPQANTQRTVSKGKVESLQSGARAVLVSVSKAPKAIQESNLIELAELAKTAGLVIAGSLIQRVSKTHPRQILSQNKLAELEVIALQGHAGIIIFDGELFPAQLHNLAELTERKILDRTQLILDIFAQHANTSAGKLQVEMAQLKYTQPRLAGKNRGMDRLMGGIGGRGPGETKLETDRRRVRERIARIKNELENLKKQRAANRYRRSKQELPVAALVGYTNAGKSTLLNHLTKSDVIAEDKLFATLDPSTRRLRFPKEKEMVLADTVGFIRELPKDLVEAFRATLEELNEADLLIHVIDASHPEMDQQLLAVESILQDLDLQEIPQLLLLNKWDDVSKEERFALSERFPDAFAISALTGFGLEALTKHIEHTLF